ncbi:MAG: hypothetical protein NT164_02570 [Verrucomicrobiae bacterium]|nr:hypothetical protein [Verrucomicrobiae bacterium]
MQPLYFNPLDVHNNYIGTNPLATTGVPIKTSIYPYFNPSIYQSFTFYSFPVQTLYTTALIGSATLDVHSVPGELQSVVTGGVIYYDEIAYSTMEFFSLLDVISTQFSTFETFYASYIHIDPITYNVRFGTELRPVIASTAGAIDTWNTYEYCFSQQFFYYSYIVATWLFDRLFDGFDNWYYYGDTQITGLSSYVTESGVFFENVVSSTHRYLPGRTILGSSSFVNIMGSNVYTGLIDTTNSIIIYQNEQVSSYFSQSLSYQVNIANLTAALNSVSSGSGSQESGNGAITVTNFSWTWESTTQGWTGSQNTTFNGYLSNGVVVNVYLSVNYGGTVITNSSIAVTQVQSLITVQNNDLANSQTFMNNAVTTLQSQVSLAGQIIGTLSSIMQSIISNI